MLSPSSSFKVGTGQINDRKTSLTLGHKSNSVIFRAEFRRKKAVGRIEEKNTILKIKVILRDESKVNLKRSVIRENIQKSDGKNGRQRHFQEKRQFSHSSLTTLQKR